VNIPNQRGRLAAGMYQALDVAWPFAGNKPRPIGGLRAASRPRVRGPLEFVSKGEVVEWIGAKRGANHGDVIEIVWGPRMRATRSAPRLDEIREGTRLKFASQPL
jgi:hypothetical protein